MPLTARERTLGAITLISTDPDDRYDEDDLEVAEEFGRRAAHAVDNARIFREAEEANRAKSEFLATISHEARRARAATER